MIWSHHTASIGTGSGELDRDYERKRANERLRVNVAYTCAFAEETGLEHGSGLCHLGP